MKVYSTRRAYGLFILVLLFFGFAAFNAFEAKSLDRAEDPDIDRLFSDIGIVKTRNALPVEIKLKDLDGRPVSLSDFRGKIVFLNFWTTWCFDCRVEMPHMEKLHQRFKDKEFAMVTINLQESVAQVKQFFKKFKLTFISLLDSDGETGAHFRITAIPTTFILDKQGIIIGKVMGPRKWDGKKAFALFEHLTISGLMTSDHVQRQGAS